MPIVYSVKLDFSVKLVVCPMQKTPVALKKKVKAELDPVVEIGIFKPIMEPMDWVSLRVASCKKNGDIRICIVPRDLSNFYAIPDIRAKQELYPCQRS